MFIKKKNGEFVFAERGETLRYTKEVIEKTVNIDENGNEYEEEKTVLKNAVVFNAQPEHFMEAGYKELVKTPIPEILPNQYVETSYELKDGKYYEVHKTLEVSL